MDDDRSASVFGFFFYHVTRGHTIECSFNCKCSCTWLKVCHKSAAIIFPVFCSLENKKKTWLTFRAGPGVSTGT